MSPTESQPSSINSPVHSRLKLELKFEKIKFTIVRWRQIVIVDPKNVCTQTLFNYEIVYIGIKIAD
jgi:hypothetical protein